jgi:hypothetical protein
MAVAAAAGGLLVIAAHRLWRDAGSGGE